MSVNNGQVANATTFNNAFMSRTANTSTVGTVALQHPGSGAAVANVQQTLNDLSSDVAAAELAIAAVEAEFDPVTGHTHDGADSPPVSAGDLDDFNTLFCEHQRGTVTNASGTSDDVSSQFTGKVSGGGVTDVGVLTGGTVNRCEIRNQITLEAYDDGAGNPVYGRLTEAAGVWTLSYYSLISGVETPFGGFPLGDDLYFYYREVFTQETRPTVPANLAEIGGSGGGGAAGDALQFPVTWYPQGDNVAGDTQAAEGFYGGRRTFDFDPDSEQVIWASCQVPQSYTPGDQVFIRGLGFITAATSGNIAFEAISFLDAQGSGQHLEPYPSTDFYDSINTPVAASGTSNRHTDVGDVDVCSPTGTINSVDVTPGKFISVRLKINASSTTAAETIRLLRDTAIWDFGG